MNWLIVLGIFTILIIAYTVYKIFRNKNMRNEKVKEHADYLMSISSTYKPSSPVEKPNIIIFFMDDMGFGDLGCYGTTNIRTPNIDKLATEGVKFNTFYSSAPVCSPSRAGILTGRYPIRSHISNVFFPKRSLIDIISKIFSFFPFGVTGLLADEITIPEVLQKVGYTTGMLGKWHLGDRSPHLPNDKGFEFFYGALYSNDMQPYAIWRNRTIEQPAPADQDHLTQHFTREGINFIRNNKDRSFFLHYCQPFPHYPLHASENFRGTSQGGLYGDAVQEIDWSVGELVKVLEELKIREKTLIFFTSDNGPWHEGNPGFHRGRKGLPYEGGQRVPMIVNWPGKIPPGKVINEMAMNIDLFPTILSLLNISLPTDRIIDGKDIFALMTGKTTKTPHAYLYYQWTSRILAIRDSYYKYHAQHNSDNSSYFYIPIRPLLFDMIHYDQESYDQTTRHPEIAAHLRSKLEEFKKELKSNPRGWIKK